MRLPQLVKSKAGFLGGEKTSDHDYTDLERHFAELEREAKKLNEDATRFKDSTIALLNAQCSLGGYLQELYTPLHNKASADEKKQYHDNYPEAKATVAEYSTIVTVLRDAITPEIEEVELRVVKPSEELLDVLKKVRKMCTKRDHKVLDFDRHRATAKKLKDKKERTLNEEKALYKTETLLEQATQEYEFYNELLKEELPKLFEYQARYIEPLFQTFYYIQLNVFYVLQEKMQPLKSLGYFDIGEDVISGYTAKKGDTAEQVEKLNIVKYGARPNIESLAARRKALKGDDDLALDDESVGSSSKHIHAPPASASAAGTSTRRPNPARPFYSHHRRSASEGSLAKPALSGKAAEATIDEDEDAHAPPPYSASTKPGARGATGGTPASRFAAATRGLGGANLGRSPSLNSHVSNTPGVAPKPSALRAAAIAKGKGPPPPPPVASKPRAVTYVRAVYDYEAQADGDLSFAEGDMIEVIKRGGEEEWWKGRLNGAEGVFPGNYVEDA